MGRIEEITYLKKTENFKKDKEKILEFAFDFAEREYANYDNNLKFEKNKIFDSEEEAEEYLENLKPYDDRAVLYKKYSKIKSKKISILKEKLEKNELAKEEYLEKNKLNKRKSKTIKCNNCGSILNIEYLTKFNEREHNCPLCNSELFSKTIIKKIQKFENDRKEIINKMKAEEKKLQKKKGNYELYWLAKFEVHR